MIALVSAPDPEQSAAGNLEKRASAGELAAQLQLAQTLTQEGRPGEASDWLRRAARSGDATARAALGRHLLEHQPQAAHEGLALLLGAAQESAEAAHLVALFTAAGIGVPQSFSAALDLLQRSAELGHGLAQAELALLAGDPSSAQPEGFGQAPTSERFEQLRRACNPEALLMVPAVEIASSSPRIGVIRGFASAAVCDWLIERARPRVEPAQIFDTGTGLLRPDENRTNRETHFQLLDCDLITMLTRVRLATAIGAPVLALELTAILNYAPGQQYAPHVDYFDASLSGYAQEVASNGQRVLTFLLYLNDDYEGGETEFPILGARFRGAKGDALFFWNIEPSGAVDPRTLHAGLPPTRGEKWLLSQWVRMAEPG
jgi:prolyl 4-hydroxylase